MLSSSLALAALGAGCQEQQGAQQGSEEPKVAVTQQAGTLDELAKQCGLTCPDKGIVDGNASISGVASVDSFFQAVLDFQAKADNVSGGIDAQLAAIRGDFGIAAGADLEAELKAQISANVEGSLTVDAEPAKCEVDAQATIQAQAKCDVDVKPGMASVKCEGSCQVEASAMASCSADADLQCTVQAPSVACSGECKGSCEVMVDGSAACDGSCSGSCSGNCSAYVKDAMGNAQCSGKCDGMCTGSCKAELAAEAKCSGKCEGECKLTNPPKAMCDGAIRAECKAHANAMVDCKGHCDGKFEPPSAKADCQASAKAEAKVNVECTPPRVAIKYSLKAGVDATAQAKFVAGIKNLEVRLPALLASIKKASIVAEAGADIVGDGKTAVSGAINGAVDGESNLRAKIGLGCALTQLDDVGKAVKTSSDKLAGSLSASAKITAALGV